jgi:hypothetical protein
VQMVHMSESNLMGAASRCWVSQLTAAMKGELNSGLGAQVQSMSLSAVSGGCQCIAWRVGSGARQDSDEGARVEESSYRE